MLATVIGVYTLCLIIVWGLFVLVRIHALKFKNFQTRIVGYLNLLFTSLLVLSILGYIVIVIMSINGVFDKGFFNTPETSDEMKVENDDFLKQRLDKNVYY